jgi:hypothetical protein
VRRDTSEPFRGTVGDFLVGVVVLGLLGASPWSEEDDGFRRKMPERSFMVKKGGKSRSVVE